jgi:hypothetical protein
MNYFKRRKILRKANFLELTPVRLIPHELREDGNVTLQMPRFRNRITASLFQPGSKSRFIGIKLDTFGSPVWLSIDGKTSVAAICHLLTTHSPEKFPEHDETMQRVTRFMTRLYQERYISFNEILEG